MAENMTPAARGCAVTAMHTALAVKTGSTITLAAREEIGHRMFSTYRTLTDVEGDEEKYAFASLVADIFHYADGLISPESLIVAARQEISMTANIVPLAWALNGEARSDLIAAALAAVICHSFVQGIDVAWMLAKGMAHWADEAEERRFEEARERRDLS